MEALTPNPILQFNENQLNEVRKLYKYDDRNRLLQDIDLFEDWIKKQNHFRVRKFDREYLERYLITNKGSIERAKKHFDKLCTSRNLMPEFLQKFDIRNEFQPLQSCVYLTPMPKPTRDNYRVGLSSLFGYHEKMTFVMYYRYALVFLEYAMKYDYCVGYVFILDTREMPFSMVQKMNPVVISRALTLITDTMGNRIKSLHFLNGSKFFDTVISLFRNAMSEKLNKRLHVHDSIESLHKFVDKDILPIDYGGTGKTLKEYDEILFEALSTDEHIQRVKFFETVSTDESCRLTSKFNEEYSGTPGSFKTLCLD